MLIKFCGMRQAGDLHLAAMHGVDFCGFIFHPKSPRNVTLGDVINLPSYGMKRVGVFVSQDAGEILEIMRLAKLDYAQLHGNYDRNAALKIGPARVIRVLWPARYSSVAQLEESAREYADTCAFYLLDSGESGGGSGNSLDWSKLGSPNLPHPFFLAGGLSAANARRAASLCQPAGLDFNSGLESAPGAKCRKKMLAALQSVLSKGESDHEIQHA